MIFFCYFFKKTKELNYFTLSNSNSKTNTTSVITISPNITFHTINFKKDYFQRKRVFVCVCFCLCVYAYYCSPVILFHIVLDKVIKVNDINLVEKKHAFCNTI